MQLAAPLSHLLSLARLRPVAKPPQPVCPALRWSGSTLSAIAYDVGTDLVLGTVDYEGGEFAALTFDYQGGLRFWRTIGTYSTVQQARSALEADVAARCSLQH